MSNVALIVAAGRSERFGGSVPKQYLEIAGRPLLYWTISRFEKADSIDKIVVVVAPDRIDQAQTIILDKYNISKPVVLVAGGDKRQESVLNGLKAIDDEAVLVAIHDGARPLVLPKDIDAAVSTAAESRAAILAIPATDTLKRVEDGFIVATLRRETVFRAQTPQVFELQLILNAHLSGGADDVTDDAALIEKLGVRVAVVEPTGPNLKVTTPEDLRTAELLLAEDANV